MPRTAARPDTRRRDASVAASRGRVRLILAVVAVVSAAAVAAGAWVLWPRPAARPGAHQYLDATACLLTSPDGIASGTAAAPAWAALESASQSTHVMVSYLPATSTAAVPTLLNSLIERQCGVIVATGADSTVVTRAARANPRQHFLLVGGSGTRAPGNLTLVAPSGVRSGVSQALQAIAARATPVPS